jgi:hypothetical protein
MEERIKHLYFNSPTGGLSTAQRLYEAAKKEYPNISLRQVQQVLSKLEVYTMYTNRYKKRSHEERMVVTGPFELFQMDLAFFPLYRKFLGILLW